ncbi:MAG TPA: hypothetical protein DET40_01975 [Lentisphaeria bacterium]|nr:MAG: hypothetical protein A2X45_11000 [Lentisphaerae bacterium GWF2_50_93]HCE42300.1 hypothetical protein [Lentisphaeria bacterium]
MSTTTIKVNQADIDRVGRLLHKISYETGRDMFGLVRQAMIMALQSSAKATKPGKSGTATGLAKKYKQRPILSSSVKAGYYYELQDGKTFRTDEEITLWHNSRTLQNVKRRLDKVIQWWNKKQGGWDYTAYTGTPEQEKFLKIPHAGAGKVGWYGSLAKLGKGQGGYGDNNGGALSKAHIQRGQLEAGIAVTNMVDYVSKTSPESASTGLANAEQRMIKTFEKKLQITIAGTY